MLYKKNKLDIGVILCAKNIIKDLLLEVFFLE